MKHDPPTTTDPTAGVTGFRILSDVQTAVTVLGRLPQRRRIPRVDLVGAHLVEASLGNTHLEEADLRFAHLEGADLFGAHLEGADLRVTHLEGARLFGAHLEGANLRAAHLERASLNAAHLEGANLIGAHLEGAGLFFAEGLTQEQANEARGDKNTQLPSGLVHPWTGGPSVSEMDSTTADQPADEPPPPAG